MKLNAPRTKRPARRKTVKLRTNGKHPVKGASVNAPIGMNRLLRPQARYNWLMPNIGAITPQYIEMVLRGALAGAHVPQYELFDLMLSTWPELSACCQELTYGVMRKKLVYEPFHDEDEKPTPNAIDRCALVSTALRQMEPDPDHDGNDLGGTLTNILDGWIRGVSVSEIVWESTDTMNVGTIAAPRTTFWVQPTQYGFAWDNTIGLRPRSERAGQTQPPFSTTSSQPVIVDPFPPNKFLVAIHKAKTGSPLGGPLLIPLAWWWCAANFSSDWLLNLAQVFGLPFRWANYAPNAPQATIDAICNMLQNMGSAGWAAFPVGTTLEMISQNAQGSDHSPQGELLDRADRYARNLILGQTMTGTHGTTGKGGGQAFGAVEADVKSDRIDAAGRFAESVINKQLIPMILALNYGDANEPPKIKFLEDEVADLSEAQRDTALSKLMPIGLDYLRKKYDVPEPAEGEETTADNAATQNPMDQFGGFNDFGAADPNSETNEDQSAPEDLKAGEGGDKAGHKFRGNQYTGGKPDYSNWQDHKQIMMVAGGSNTGYNAQLSYLEREGIPFETHGAAALGSRRQHISIPYHRHSVYHARKAGMTISKHQSARYLTHDILTDEELPELKSSDITLRSPSELRPSVVDNHIVRGYMARIESGEQLDPVELKSNGRIKDGNHRAAAYKQLGLQVPTVIEAGDKPGHAFRGNQYVNIGETVNTPHGRGIVVAQDYHNVWVSTTKGIKVVPRNQVLKVPQDKSKFPSLLHSAENERRAALNSKLEELNEIEDDVVFAEELKQLAEGIK